MIDTDSLDYHVIEHATEFIKNVPGLTCEIGLRTGGGTKIILETIQRTHPQIRTHISIDPYGSLPYVDYMNKWPDQGPYHNEMMRQAMVDLYSLLAAKPRVNFLFFPMEDTEFFKRFGDGVPVYLEGRKKIISQYALVVFDGPHTAEQTLAEAKFFTPRTAIGAILVFDDTGGDFYDHSVVDQYVTANGWEKLDVKSHKKTAYQKTS